MQANHNLNVRARGARGFTLIELLLVMAILAVLAAVVVPKFVGRGEQAKVTAAQTDISNMKTALNAYEVDNGGFPSTNDGLQALVVNPNPSVLKNWHGPYLEEVRKDPWGNDYIYRYPGSLNPNGFDIVSVGKDGAEGTEDDVNNAPAAK